MGTARRIIGPLAALVALAAFFLPAVRLDLSGMPRPTWSATPQPEAAWQVRTWTSAALLPSGWLTLRGQPSDFAAGMDNVNLARAIMFASRQPLLEVSGIFRLGPFLPVPLLLAAAFFGLALLLAALRRAQAASLAIAIALMCDIFAVVPFVWIAVVAHSQRALLRSYGDTPPGGIHLRLGLFLLPAALLVLSSWFSSRS